MSEKTYWFPARSRSGEGSARPGEALELLATLLTAVVVVGLLYFAREILVPIAIAVLLSFALSPLIKALRKLGLGKTLSVGVVVCATFLTALGLGAILAKEVTDLAAEAPRFQTTMMRKVETARQFAATSPLLNKLEAMMADLQVPSRLQTAVAPNPSTPPAQRSAPGNDATPVRVQLVSPPPGVLDMLQAAIGAAASPLATAAFVAIFIVFILMQREDLRNRFIRLAGTSDLQRTTLAMNDAATRLGRYLLIQILLNTGFGIVTATALWIIGVPSAVLWGIVAAFMRFVPYIGAVGAAFFPIVLAAASGSGWAMTIETAVFFAVLELVVGQMVEPLVYGRHTGISPIAVVASATFWTWLWGPVGLLLSTPMTVCLVVMGRHVRRLSFLDVLLGDAPALTEIEVFYQRMLSGDPLELLDHADMFTTERSLLAYCDEIAMKALAMAQTDVNRGALDIARQSRIRDTMRVLAASLLDREDASALPVAQSVGSDGGQVAEIGAAWARPRAVLCFAARTPLDEAAAHLLADVLNELGIGAAVEPAERLMRRDASDIDAGETQLVVLSLLDADLSLAQAKAAERRLRRRVPSAALLAAFWQAPPDEVRRAALCNGVRADACAFDLPTAVKLCLARAAGGPTGEETATRQQHTAGCRSAEPEPQRTETGAPA